MVAWELAFSILVARYNVPPLPWVLWSLGSLHPVFFFFFFLDLVKALQTRPKEGRKTRASEPTDLGRNLFPLKARLVEG